MFQLVPERSRHRRDPSIPLSAYGRPLFAHDASIDKLEKRLDDGWEITATKLTKAFRAHEYFAEHPAAMVLAAQRRGVVVIHDAGQHLRLVAGDTVISLLPPSDRDARNLARNAGGRRRRRRT